jgi:hypothetical protein
MRPGLSCAESCMPMYACRLCLKLVAYRLAVCSSSLVARTPTYAPARDTNTTQVCHTVEALQQQIAATCPTSSLADAAHALAEHQQFVNHSPD